MKKSEQKKEQKRNDIIRAAQETFRTDGYIGASMDKIAQCAGVTKQTVYRYFPSKEVLFQASLEARRAGLDRQFQGELAGEDPYEALTRFAIGFLQLHMSEDHLAGVRLLVAEGPNAPELTRAFFAFGPHRTAECLKEFLTAKFHVEDPEYAAKMFLSTLLALRMNVLVGLIPVPTHEDIVRHAERTVAVFMNRLKE